jgi:hypothetical protein
MYIFFLNILTGICIWINIGIAVGVSNEDIPFTPVLLIANVILLANICVNIIHFRKLKRTVPVAKFIGLDVALPLACVLLIWVGVLGGAYGLTTI